MAIPAGKELKVPPVKPLIVGEGLDWVLQNDAFAYEKLALSKAFTVNLNVFGVPTHEPILGVTLIVPEISDAPVVVPVALKL